MLGSLLEDWIADDPALDFKQDFMFGMVACEANGLLTRDKKSEHIHPNMDERAGT